MIGIITMEKQENRPLNSVGSSRIRGSWLWKYWDDAEEFQIGKHYDEMIFQKVYWRDMLREYDGIKIFDLCDPDHLDNRPVIESVSHCDALVTSTEALADYYRKLLTIPVVCIPDRLDLSEFTKVKEHKGQAKSCVWYGYSHNARVLDFALDIIENLGLSLTVVSNDGYSVPSVKRGFKVTNVKYTYETINDRILEHDIVILPQGTDKRFQYKSNNKDLSAWVLGMPVAHTADDLEKFMSEEERIKESELRLQEVKDKWDIKLSVKEYEELINGIKTKSK